MTTVSGIDCSKDYLAAIDTSGFVAINYQYVFPMWAIILIVSGSIVIFIAVIYGIVKLRKNQLLKAQ